MHLLCLIPFLYRKNNKDQSLKCQIERVMILVFNIAIAQIAITIQSWPSSARYYAC